MWFYPVKTQVSVEDPDRRMRLVGTVFFERNEYGHVAIDDVPAFVLERVQIEMPELDGRSVWCEVAPDDVARVNRKALARKYAKDLRDAVYAACDMAKDLNIVDLVCA